MKRKLLIILCVLFVVAFIVGAVKVVGELWVRNKDATVYEELAEMVAQATVELEAVAAQTIQEDSQEIEEEASPYQSLYELNSDMVGWVEIPDTMLNYPVMHSPYSAEYYLRRDFYKDYSISGTPFMDATCTLESDHIILYGHHMYDGTMFATLLDYLDASFRQAHPLIYFNPLTENRTYEVVYGFYQEVDGSTWTEGYYKYSTLEEFEVFQAYAVSQDVLGSGGEISYDDELLSLITCSGFDDDIRFVLVARRIT